MSRLTLPAEWSPLSVWRLGRDPDRDRDRDPDPDRDPERDPDPDPDGFPKISQDGAAQTPHKRLHLRSSEIYVWRHRRFVHIFYSLWYKPD